MDAALDVIKAIQASSLRGDFKLTEGPNSEWSQLATIRVALTNLLLAMDRAERGDQV